MSIISAEKHAAAPRIDATPSDQSRWAAVLARDVRTDGSFVYCVTTTGVYCRPSCAARRPQPQNVTFQQTAQAAEDAGFRACKRCRPDAGAQRPTHALAVERACRRIDDAEEVPSLEQLAADAGMSRFHFHRVFRALTGVTPRGYAAARRRERLQSGLHESQTVTEAAYGAGYNSNSRLYAAAAPELGMAPSHYRRHGEGSTIRFAVGESSLGAILVAATLRGICAIELGDDPQRLVERFQERFAKAEIVGADAAFERLVATVVGLIERPDTNVARDLPLDVVGTAFQQRVWSALRAIPLGRTASYGEIANTIGTGGARAVAAACASNPVAVAIPCHRVVRSTGETSGYRWGVERKRELLKRERAT